MPFGVFFGIKKINLGDKFLNFVLKKGNLQAIFFNKRNNVKNKMNSFFILPIFQNKYVK